MSMSIKEFIELIDDFIDDDCDEYCDDCVLYKNRINKTKTICKMIWCINKELESDKR